jgi:SM-20-related protein
LEKSFDTLINSFIANKVGIAENFLSDGLALHLRENLSALYTGDELRSAGTGNETLAVYNKEFRGDVIHWLDRTHTNVHEIAFFKLMDHFVDYLNSTCYTGITGYEFHYTLYQKGSFYKKHLDQFRNNESRQYSMIVYLNPGWQEKDGGELRIHHDDHQQTITPENRKMVFFKSSELEHEVLTTQTARMSITGWLNR